MTEQAARYNAGKRREYESGMQWCVWRWKDIYWNGELYLRRLHVFQCPLFAVMVHWILQPDQQDHPHDHPVSMLTILLRGWYSEEVDWWGCSAWQERRRWFNWIPARKAHRIVETSPGGCVTLAICGPREREWGFWTSKGWIPWRQYLREYGGETS